MLSWSNNSAFTKKYTETMRWKVQFFLPWSQLLLRMTMQNSKPSASLHNTLQPPKYGFLINATYPRLLWCHNTQTPSGNFLFYVILTIYYLRAQTIETSSLPNDPMRPMLKQMAYWLYISTVSTFLTHTKSNTVLNVFLSYFRKLLYFLTAFKGVLTCFKRYWKIIFNF